MIRKGFRVQDVLLLGWSITRKNLLFLAGVALVVSLGPIAMQFMADRYLENITVLRFLFWIASLILSFELTLGVYKIALNFVDDIPSEVANLFDFFHLVPQLIIGTVIYTVIVLAGLILIVVPGIVWSLKYSLFAYFILEDEMSAMDALRASAAATDGAKWPLLWLELSSIILVVLGLLCMVVGIFVALPVVYIAMAQVYRILKSQTRAIALDSPTKTVI
jgi:uncharacterized membrane protein